MLKTVTANIKGIPAAYMAVDVLLSIVNVSQVFLLQTIVNLFVYDIACLGNKLKLIKDNIVWFTERGVSIFSAKEDYVFRPDTATKQLLDGVELALDMRKSMVSALTSKALDKVKRSGKKLGQKKGRRIRHLLDGKEDKIRSLLRQKISKAEIARQMGVSYLTLFNFVKQNQLESENG